MTDEICIEQKFNRMCSISVSSKTFVLNRNLTECVMTDEICIEQKFNRMRNT
jgi:hypothetical protein